MAEQIAQAQTTILTLPEDPQLRAQLAAKLLEYQGRYKPYQAPESQMDTICKLAVLGRLMDTGSVDTWALSLQLHERYGSGFEASWFNNAVSVIRVYIGDSTEPIFYGSGLPEAPTPPVA